MREEPVRLEMPSPDWVQRFRAEALLLRERFEPFGVRSLEHVGSTSVPGILAKPIVDIAVEVERFDELPASGSEFWHELCYGWGHGDDPPDGWLYFIKRSRAGERTFHLHVAPVGSALTARMVAFRDALLRDPGLARQYEAIKKKLAAAAGSRAEYRDGKAAFIESVLDEKCAQRRWPG